MKTRRKSLKIVENHRFSKKMVIFQELSKMVKTCRKSLNIIENYHMIFDHFLWFSIALIIFNDFQQCSIIFKKMIIFFTKIMIFNSFWPLSMIIRLVSKFLQKEFEIQFLREKMTNTHHRRPILQKYRMFDQNRACTDAVPNL